MWHAISTCVLEVLRSNQPPCINARERLPRNTLPQTRQCVGAFNTGYALLCDMLCISSSDIVLSMLGHISHPYQSWWFLIIFWNDYFIIICNIENPFLFRGQGIHLARMIIHIFLQAALHWWCNLILEAHKNHTHTKDGVEEHFVCKSENILWV
jgi:hypothetical protein